MAAIISAAPAMDHSTMARLLKCRRRNSRDADALPFVVLVDGGFADVKPWYQPESDDVILTASFGLTVGEACRRLGVRNLVASEVDVETMKVTYLNFNTNKTKRFRELYGPDAVIDEFYTDSKFDQPMIDMARHAFMVKGNTITQVK